jgi:C1A family cysteine protease
MISRRATLKSLLACTVVPYGASLTRALAAAPMLQPTGVGYSLYKFGWKPDLPIRLNLYRFDFSLSLATAPPPSVDLRPEMPDVYDQHDIGACTSNAVAACIQFVRRKNHLPNDFVPSRLFIYYFGRQIEQSIDTDGGLAISDAITVIENKGVPSEADWPYDGTAPDEHNKFQPTSRAIAPPRQAILNEAGLHRTTSAFSLDQDLGQMKACLALGYPFVFGFTIYKSFFDNNATPPLPLKTIPMPPDADQPVGGHAVVAVGYKDDQTALGGGYLICRNSWGLKDIADRPMQDGGHFYMPYAYALDRDLSSAFWTIRVSS